MLMFNKKYSTCIYEPECIIGNIVAQQGALFKWEKRDHIILCSFHIVFFTDIRFIRIVFAALFSSELLNQMQPQNSNDFEYHMTEHYIPKSW